MPTTHHESPVRPNGRPGPRPRGGPRPGRPQLSKAARALRRLWATTPARLKLLRAAVLLLLAALTALLGTAGLAALGAWDSTAGRDAPRTISAARLNLALNDMDAQVANLLLANGDAGAGRLRVPYDKAVEGYDASRHTISTALRTLSVAAQHDRAAARTVETLTEDFVRYQERVGRALENDGRKGGKAAAVEDYRTATDLLDRRLLPQARALVAANDTAYERHYDAARSRLTGELLAAVTLGALLLAVLAGLQWYLARRFRRVLNPGLAAATLCALTGLALGCQLLASSSQELRVARRDAFDSVVALSRAHATVYDANADESRYLLMKERRDRYQRSFFTKSQKLYGIAGTTLSDYDARLDETWGAYRSDRKDLRFTGEFRRELDNITFPGERAAAEAAVRAYAVYQRDDRTIRRLIGQGRERAAVDFCISWQDGTSNSHFLALDRALKRVTGINQAHFDRAADDGRNLVSGPPAGAGGAFAAAALCAVLGLRPRLAEFR
ncbi:hypothetical protein [Streptomyces sp. NPDC059063]|uniref:hypothetical protein n=1 Tax=unclassified Streptomyces TaxID=2593676 RepID=UPI0036B58689